MNMFDKFFEEFGVQIIFLMIVAMVFVGVAGIAVQNSSYNSIGHIVMTSVYQVKDADKLNYSYNGVNYYVHWDKLVASKSRKVSYIRSIYGKCGDVTIAVFVNGKDYPVYPSHTPEESKCASLILGDIKVVSQYYMDLPKTEVNTK